MNKSIKKNYIYNLIYQVLTIILPLITTPYLARVLGAECIGIYSYTLSITTYFILIGSLGVAKYGQREIAFYQDDKQKRSKSFYEIFTMRFISLFISIVVFYLFFCIKGKYLIYYKILLLEIFANVIDISWFFQGLEEFKKTVTRNALVKIISVLCIFMFIKSNLDLKKYFFIYVLSNLIGNGTLWIYLPKYIEKIHVRSLNIFKHLKPIIELFIPQIAVQIYMVLDKTMIGSIIEDKSEVGFYEQSQKMVRLVLTIVTSLGVVMIPRMANMFANGKKEKINEYLYNSFRFSLFLIFPLMFGLISISNKFVPIFFGSGYDKVVYLIIIISPIILAIGLNDVIGTQYLLPTKQQKKYTISVVGGAIVNFILNMIFIRLWKSIGASIATVFAEMTVTGIQIYLVRKDISFKKILKIGKNYFFSAIIMLIVSLGLGFVINNNLISIIVQVISASITYFSILILLKDKIIFQAIEILKKNLRRKKINE